MLAIAQARVVASVAAEQVGGVGDTSNGASYRRDKSACECLERNITEKLTREGSLPGLEGGGTGREDTSEEGGGEGEAHIDNRYNCKDRKAQVAGKIEELATGVQKRGK